MTIHCVGEEPDNTLSVPNLQNVTHDTSTFKDWVILVSINSDVD